MLLTLAWRSLCNRAVSVGLTLLALTLSVMLLVSVEHVRREARDSFGRTVSGVDLIVGARTSPLNLLLYAIFRIGAASNEQDVDVSTALFNRYYRLTPKEGEKSVRVIARFTNGAPALVERSFGLGKVVMVASTADLEWNDLPARPFFLPMLHQMVAYLASGTDGTRNGLVGETLVKPIPLGEASRKTVVSQPNGNRTQVRPLVDERGAVVTLENPRSAGFYRLAVDGGTQDLFAVNRDATESDLRVLGEAALRRLLPFEGWGWVGPNEDLLGAVNRSRQGVELWRHFLFAALGLMILETMLAQLFGRRA